jgi:TonB family protein
MLALLLALFAAAPAAAPAAPPNTVSGVTVSPPPKTGPIAATIDMASDESAGGDFTAIWPAGAYFKGGEGRVTLNCLIDAFGLAERCTVAAETPKNQGFGRAALEMRPTFKLKPATGADGQPVNAMMSIKVSFKPPKKDLVGIQATQAEIRSFHDINGLIDSKSSQAGNGLAMRKVTMLDDPIWLTAANFDDLARAYPARGGGIEGYAAAHCQVVRSGTAAGSLKDCQIIKESPDGHDFGKAVLSLAGRFHLAPSVAAQAPNRNEVWVDIPIRLPPPTARSERTVMAPVWILGVDPRATPKVFPPEAVAGGLTTGRGIARCTVGPDGVTADCTPEAGEPDGLGFSEAAAKLATGLKMNLWSADGAPVAGAVVHIPIRLNLKGN